jgi:hypothetical protein
MAGSDLAIDQLRRPQWSPGLERPDQSAACALQRVQGVIGAGDEDQLSGLRRASYVAVLGIRERPGLAAIGCMDCIDGLIETA